MAGGNNSAKQTLISQVDNLVDELKNGTSNHQKTQATAMALLLEMFKPLYMAEFVKVDECIKKHEEILKQIEPNKAIKIKLGPLEIAGSFSQTVILGLIMSGGFGGLIYVIGKTQSWW